MCRVVEGSTVGYEKQGMTMFPVKAENSYSKNDIQDIQMCDSIVIRIAKLFANYSFMDINARNMALSSKEILSRVSYNPSRKIISALAPKLHYQHYSESFPIVTKLYPIKLGMLLYRLVNKKRSPLKAEDRVTWIEGSLIYTYGYIGVLMNKNMYKVIKWLK